MRRVLREIRRELWLWLAVFATDHALDLCEMPQDEATIRKIRDSTEVWVQPDPAIIARAKSKLLSGCVLSTDELKAVQAAGWYR